MIVLVLLSVLPRDTLWSPSSTAFSKSKIKLNSFGCICFWRSFKDRSLVRSSSSFVHDDSISRHTKHGSQKKNPRRHGGGRKSSEFYGAPDQPAVLNSIEICQSEGLHFRMLGSYVLGKFCTLVFAHPGRAILRGITNSPGNNLFCCWELVFSWIEVIYGHLVNGWIKYARTPSYSFQLAHVELSGRRYMLSESERGEASHSLGFYSR